MKKYLLLLALSFTIFKLSAQQKGSSADSLLNALNAANKPEPAHVAIFSSSRLILAETNETVKKGNLNFLVIHRFGDVGGPFGGGQTLYGLDNSSDIYIDFEYGLGEKWDVQFGRSKYQQLIELGTKYTLINQDADGSPFAVSLLGKFGLKPYKNDGSFNKYSDRFAYVAQAIIGHKFSKSFSLQITPTLVSSNAPQPVVTGNEKTFFSLGAAARLKVTKRMGIVVDYAHSFSSFRDNPPLGYQFYDPLGVGIEVETGGHVFTINFSNAKAISPSNYLADTRSNWGKGEFRLGFTISRIFDLSHRNKNNY
ncbi:DUF5777 family beta-barrel protein [Mucilaginibacter auburnensis]|uniref:DUF5777 domain-containing protein n=1 Tax=Mucilaginibacter auburnensis TaxID=1457233 RepID=A0A2H9VQL7_9SPHI|nr:DUF5777 family beta-barrel protein [Mucilaginibacter auburnensis]PJJ83126.1 hypothetical protein CLV57_0104 [Mucilaginibacter auburnensis]